MFNTIDDIKEANRQIGQKWFEEGTMGFFSSQIEPKVYHGCYFISSEKYELSDVERAKGMPELPRKWTIRGVNARGWVFTVGDYGQYDTLAQAEEAVQGAVGDLLPVITLDDCDLTEAT